MVQIQRFPVRISAGRPPQLDEFLFAGEEALRRDEPKAPVLL